MPKSIQERVRYATEHKDRLKLPEKFTVSQWIQAFKKQFGDGLENQEKEKRELDQAAENGNIPMAKSNNENEKNKFVLGAFTDSKEVKQKAIQDIKNIPKDVYSLQTYKKKLERSSIDTKPPDSKKYRSRNKEKA